MSHFNSKGIGVAFLLLLVQINTNKKLKTFTILLKQKNTLSKSYDFE